MKETKRITSFLILKTFPFSAIMAFHLNRNWNTEENPSLSLLKKKKKNLRAWCNNEGTGVFNGGSRWPRGSLKHVFTTERTNKSIRNQDKWQTSRFPI
jgi:hypothetical protein